VWACFRGKRRMDMAKHNTAVPALHAWAFRGRRTYALPLFDGQPVTPSTTHSYPFDPPRSGWIEALLVGDQDCFGLEQVGQHTSCVVYTGASGRRYPTTHKATMSQAANASASGSNATVAQRYAAHAVFPSHPHTRCSQPSASRRNSWTS